MTEDIKACKCARIFGMFKDNIDTALAKSRDITEWKDEKNLLLTNLKIDLEDIKKDCSINNDKLEDAKGIIQILKEAKTEWITSNLFALSRIVHGAIDKCAEAEK